MRGMDNLSVFFGFNLPGFSLPMREADLKSIKLLIMPVSAIILALQVFFIALPEIVKQTPLSLESHLFPGILFITGC